METWGPPEGDPSPEPSKAGQASSALVTAETQKALPRWKNPGPDGLFCFPSLAHNLTEEDILYLRQNTFELWCGKAPE